MEKEFLSRARKHR